MKINTYNTMFFLLLVLFILSPTLHASDPFQRETTKNKSAPTAILGSMPYVTVLFRFSDYSDIPRAVSYFEALMSSPDFPSVDHYFRETSYNRMNINGSEVHGWYDLPGTRAHYHYTDGKGEIKLDLDAVISEGLKRADHFIDFSKFVGINVMFNVDLLIPPFSTRRTIEFDNITRSYGLTFQGPWGFNRMDVSTHEMMHNFGLMHSSGPYDETYDSQWDRMSGSTCPPSTPDPIYGCLGVHTIAYHKLLLGWIDENRNFKSGSNGAAIVNIERLEFPPLAPNNYLLASLAVPGSNSLFTVEYRRLLGYDGVGAIPGEAVIIHFVRYYLPDRWAQVADPDANGNPNDDGAMWLPGETYQPGSSYIIHVESMDEERAVVSMSNQAGNPVYADIGYSGVEMGTVAQPWNSVIEAYASVYPSGDVYIKSGTYNESFKFSKPCRLKRHGPNGTVIIGK